MLHTRHSFFSRHFCSFRSSFTFIAQFFTSFITYFSLCSSSLSLGYSPPSSLDFSMSWWPLLWKKYFIKRKTSNVPWGTKTSKSKLNKNQYNTNNHFIQKQECSWMIIAILLKGFNTTNKFMKHRKTRIHSN